MRTKIIYEDVDIIVCHKPAGIATQTKSISQQDVVSELKNYCCDSKNGRKAPYIGIIHRLDQPVEGILVFAKNPKAAAALSKQVSSETGKEMEKFYHARVYGTPQEEKGTLTDYLKKDSKTNLSQIVKKEDPKGKKSVLEYQIMEKKEKETLLKIHLLTGRYHQIRVQLSNAGFPILGDKKYGSEQSKQYSVDNGYKNVELCAYKLIFTHPSTNKKVTFEL